jgi:hypothetical protein
MLDIRKKVEKGNLNLLRRLITCENVGRGWGLEPGWRE